MNKPFTLQVNGARVVSILIRNINIKQIIDLKRQGI